MTLGCNIAFLESGVIYFDMQEQPSRDVLKKIDSEHLQPIDRRTPMPKCDFNKVALVCFATLLKSHFGMGVLL